MATNRENINKLLTKQNFPKYSRGFLRIITQISTQMDDTTDKYCNYRTTDCTVTSTKDLYKSLNFPKRFECPYAFSGYGIQREQKNCIYRTTSSDYGFFTPSPHSVPSRYYPLNQQFSSRLAQTGMYRNYSLNTSFDKPFCNQY